MHPAHHICLIFCVFLLDTSIYLKAYGEVFWLQLFTSMAWNWWVLKINNLQSWTKSVKNFALSHPQNACPADLVLLTPPLTPPWSVLFTGGQKWSSHTLTLFPWGKGKVFVVASDFKSFILEQDMAKSIFINIFVQDCSSLMGYSRKNHTPMTEGTPPPPTSFPPGIPKLLELRQETHITSDMCSPSWETQIPSDMCSLTKETHITSDMCSPTQETHIPSDVPGKHISLVICVPLPRKHISLVMYPGNTYPYWYVFPYLGNTKP